MKFEDEAKAIATAAQNARRCRDQATADEAQTRATLLLASAVNELVEQNRGVGVWRDCLLKQLSR